MKRLIFAVLASIMVLGGAVACGDDEPEKFVPASFGADGQCYWVESEDEVRVLKDNDLCEQNTRPVQASSSPSGLEWLLLYHAFLSSPTYYNTYVPTQYRTVYVQNRTTFGQQHASEIRSANSRAKYRSLKTGKLTTGNKISPTKFGGGSRSGGGGGNRKTCGAAVHNGADFILKGGGGGGSRSGGGGGSRSTSRSGGSGGGSKSKTRSGAC